MQNQAVYFLPRKIFLGAHAPAAEAAGWRGKHGTYCGRSTWCAKPAAARFV